MSLVKSCSTSAVRRARVSLKNVCVTIITPPEISDVIEHHRTWFHMHPIQSCRGTGKRANPEVAVESMLSSNQRFLMGSEVALLEFRHHCVEVGAQVFWQNTFPAVSNSTGVCSVQYPPDHNTRMSVPALFVEVFQTRTSNTCLPSRRLCCHERVVSQLIIASRQATSNHLSKINPADCAHVPIAL